jgi:glycerol-3-phosphate dehydrogenase
LKRDLSELAGVRYDLVVVGGGAFGACAAWEAASRGLSVALVEKGDFCAATSANHLKVVHGGIRYLQHLDFKRVRESCHERSALLRIAPHLVQPLPIVMPTYGRGADGAAVLWAGLSLYDLLAFDRNFGIKDEARRIPGGRILSRAECLRLVPRIDSRDLTGAGLFHDAQFYNPPRLVLAFLQSAVGAGARIANYLEATGFIRERDRVGGVIARDRLTGEEFGIRGKIVLNTAGPWAAHLLRTTQGARLPGEPVFSRDAGFVVRGRRSGNHALAVRVGTKDPDAVLSRKGRHVFLVPWRDYTLVGVWHVVHRGEPESARVSEPDLDGFLEEINAAEPWLDLRREDVSMVYAGLTLFAENVPGQKDLRFGHRSMLVDHAAENGIEGLVTLIGIRATMARRHAEQAIDLVAKKLDVSVAPSRTSRTPVRGGNVDEFEGLVRAVVAEQSVRYRPEVIRPLVHNHGAEYAAILRYERDVPELAGTIGSSTTLKSEVVHALREEMAQTLGDIVFRRTDLGSGGHPGGAELRDCARLAAQELGWNAERQRREIADVELRFPESQRHEPEATASAR